MAEASKDPSTGAGAGDASDDSADVEGESGDSEETASEEVGDGVEEELASADEVVWGEVSLGPVGGDEAEELYRTATERDARSRKAAKGRVIDAMVLRLRSM